MPTQNASPLVGGMGVAMGFITSLVREVKKRGGKDEDIHRLVTPRGEETLGKIADLIVASRIPQPAITSLTVTVNCTRTVEEMVAAGKYDWKNGDINSNNFQVVKRPSGLVEVHLIHLNHVVSSDDVIKEMEKMGFRPAELPELLALGAEHPDEQRKYPIIALGSIWQDPDGRRVPGLWRGGGGRYLNLSLFDSGWYPDYRFLAVRK